MRFSALTMLTALLLSLSALGEPTQVLSLKTPEDVKPGVKYMATVQLDSPASAGGTKVILLPTHRVEMPDTVIVAEGETEAKFRFKVFKNQISDWHFSRTTVFTTLFKGEMTEWTGPRVSR